jgi:hypothetical protein
MMAFKAKKSSRVPGFRGQQFFTYYEHLKAGTKDKAAKEERQEEGSKGSSQDSGRRQAV